YFGGTSKDRDSAYADHWVLNLDNTGAGWKSAPGLPNKRLHLSGAVVNGKMYAIGGQHKHDHDPVDLNLLHAYDLSTKTWSQKASLPLPRSHFEPGTMLVNGYVVIIGGRANQSGPGNGQLDLVTAYNPGQNSWCDLRALPVPLIAPNAARIGNKIIVTGGGTSWDTPQSHTYVSSVQTSACETSDAMTELLVNSCFEAKGGDNKPDITPWTVHNSQDVNDKVKCKDTGVALEGDCAFRFKGSVGENSKLEQSVDLTNFVFNAGDTLILSGYVNANQPSTDAKIKVLVTYVDQNLAKGKLKVKLTQTSGYEILGNGEPLQLTLASGNIASIRLLINNASSSGKIYLDALSLKHTSRSAAGMNADPLVPLPLLLPQAQLQSQPQISK
ncbi:MAG TPA: hypothetical protein VHL11_07155, partial [Phototrophicaceae bacterium]|nr:hypothetical protein [Phototrophicaceae bacterium]